MADEFKGITQIIGMIPRGGKFAKSVVNAIHKAPKNWNQLKNAIRQIEDLLKQGKLKLDGKQKTIFEQNKNIYKAHEKAVTEKAKYDDITKKMWKDRKEYPPFNTSKEDFTKGWTPTVVERQNLRNVYKKLDPPERLYTKEMEAIDEELNELMLYQQGKYSHLSEAKKAELFNKLQAEMKRLIDIAKKEDLSTLSLGELNKKSHDLQRRIREMADNPNIPGTVTEGPKRNMIKALYDSENPLINAARIKAIKNKNLKKYGDKFPTLDPDNNMFIILGLDERGNPIKMGRTIGRFSATKDKMGELTSSEGMSFWDRWDPKKNKIREVGKEVYHETLNREGKTIMSNPEYKIPKTELLDINTELYTNLSTSDLAKKGFSLKQIDMIRKGREARKYLEKTKHKDHNIAMHEQTSTNEIGNVMEDLYTRGDDIYKMSIDEWIQKIPQYFTHGGRVPGFATGGVSNLFRQRYRDAGSVIKLAKGARWLIRMLKEMSDDIIFGQKQFANMVESMKMKYFKETQAAIRHLEAGNPIPENLLQTMRADKRFQNLTVSKGGDKDFQEIQEVVLGKPTKGTGEKILEGKVVDETVDLMEFKKTLPKDLLDKVNQVPIEKQTNLLTVMKRAFDAAKKGNVKSGVDVLQEQMLTDFVPKGKPHATGGLIDGYATGGVSNLFRQRQGFRTGNIAKLPEFLKFVERLLIKASNEIRQGIGKWKGLDIKQKTVQHDNLTKMVTEFMRTKKFDPKMNEYFGIDAEKAFIEAQAKVKKTVPLVSDKTLTKAYDEVFYQKPRSGDYKYDADVLADSIAAQLGKGSLDDFSQVQQTEIYNVALKRVQQDMALRREANKHMKDVEQKIELQMFDTTGKKGNAAGGLIDGYATGGVSNLFRSR